MVLAVEKTGIKWKKKKWVDILAPKLFNSKKIGETLVDEVDQMLGSTVTTSIALLTNNIKKQNLLVTLKLVKYEGDKAQTQIKSFELEQSFVSRLVRKGVSKVADSFEVECKDKRKVRVKPLIVTRGKIKSSIAKALYAKQRDLVVDYA